MRVIFDPAKDVLNIANQGVSLALAENLEWDFLVSLKFFPVFPNFSYKSMH